MRGYTNLLKITTANGLVLKLASEQLVLIEAKGWLAGNKLQLYDILIDRNGYQDYIIKIEPLEQQQLAYIFEVARDHDFYVAGILMHNPFWDTACDVASTAGDAVLDSFVPDDYADPRVRSGNPKKEVGSKTSREARREVMRKESIPTSQVPDSQSKNESGYEYRYTVPKNDGTGGGTLIKSVQDQTLDRSHLDQPHWEAGDVKINNVDDKIIMGNYDRPKLLSNKSKVIYDN